MTAIDIVDKTGGLLGAIIAGVISFIILRKTIVNQKEITDKERFLDKKQELILSLGKTRRFVIDMADQSNLQQLTTDKLDIYIEKINESLNICIFLMTEYRFLNDTDNKSLSQLMNLILNLIIAVTKKDRVNIENHKGYVKNFDLEGTNEYLQGMHMQIKCYLEDNDKLVLDYCEIFNTDVQTIVFGADNVECEEVLYFKMYASLSLLVMMDALEAEYDKLLKNIYKKSFYY